MVVCVGPQDPGSGAVLPFRPLAKYFTRELSKRIKHINFASNPCRMRFYSQEIVFFREDLLRKMRRHAIVSSEHAEAGQDISELLVETVIKQVLLTVYHHIFLLYINFFNLGPLVPIASSSSTYLLGTGLYIETIPSS